MRGIPYVLAIVVGLSSASTALADNVAEAEALFQQGRSLMKQKKYDRACPKLEESLRLDHGVGTLWHLARCYEASGRLASAWGKYHEVATEARREGQRKRARAAESAARAIESRLHRMVIVVPPEARVEGLNVARNGTDVGEGAWGSRVPVDPGAYRVEATAPGHTPWIKDIEVAGKRRVVRVTVPRLTKAALPPSPPEPVVDPPTPPPVHAEHVPAWYTDRLAWAFVGGGVALLAGGVGSLAHGSSLHDEAQMPGTIEDRERLNERADRFRLLGGGLAIAGAGAAVAGIVLLAIPQKPRRSGRMAVLPSLGVGSRAILVGVGATF